MMQVHARLHIGSPCKGRFFGAGKALERLAYSQANGDTDHAFGWSYLKEAKAWKTHSCAQMAAE